jgi:hypothetical protein
MKEIYIKKYLPENYEDCTNTNCYECAFQCMGHDEQAVFQCEVLPDLKMSKTKIQS